MFKKNILILLSFVFVFSSACNSSANTVSHKYNDINVFTKEQLLTQAKQPKSLLVKNDIDLNNEDLIIDTPLDYSYLYYRMDLSEHTLTCKNLQLLCRQTYKINSGKIIITEGDFLITNYLLTFYNINFSMNYGSKIIFQNFENVTGRTYFDIFANVSFDYFNSDEKVPIVLKDRITMMFSITESYDENGNLFFDNEYYFVIEGDNVYFEYLTHNNQYLDRFKDITVDVYGKNTKIVKNDKLIVNNFSGEEIEWLDSKYSL